MRMFLLGMRIWVENELHLWRMGWSQKYSDKVKAEVDEQIRQMTERMMPKTM